MTKLYTIYEELSLYRSFFNNKLNLDLLLSDAKDAIDIGRPDAAKQRIEMLERNIKNLREKL